MRRLEHPSAQLGDMGKIEPRVSLGVMRMWSTGELGVEFGGKKRAR